MVVIGNEVGGNLDMTGDGHMVGEKIICEKVVLHKVKQQEKQNFTVIGLKKLLGEPICCIVSIEGRE